MEGRGISGTGWTFGCGTKPVFFFSLIWSNHNRHSEYSANYYALSHNICVCSMSPAVKAFSLVSLKGRNGIFNVCNGLSACCAHESEKARQAVTSVQRQVLIDSEELKNGPSPCLVRESNPAWPLGQMR